MNGKLIAALLILSATLAGCSTSDPNKYAVRNIENDKKYAVKNIEKNPSKYKVKSIENAGDKYKVRDIVPDSR